MNWKLLNIKAVHFGGATLSWCVGGDVIKRESNIELQYCAVDWFLAM
jgi:hypothetical protein